MMSTIATPMKTLFRRPLAIATGAFVLSAAMLASSVPADGQPRQRQGQAQTQRQPQRSVRPPVRVVRPPPRIVRPPIPVAPVARPDVTAEDLESNFREPPQRDPHSRLALESPPAPLARPEQGADEERYAEPPQRDPHSRLALAYPPPTPRARPNVPGARTVRRGLPALETAPRDAEQDLAALPPPPEPRPLDLEFPPPAPEARPSAQQEQAVALPPPPPLPDEATTNTCLAELEALGVKFTRITVANENPWCQPGIPLRITAMEGDAPLRFAPPVTLDCRMARALAKWLKETVFPAAQEHLQTLPVGVSGAGYECRRRFGLTAGAMSEHALANAMDIMGFIMPEGKTINILKDYYSEEPVGVFLQKIRTEACPHFGTVLGPGSDAAHANHFHLDAKERRQSYCR